MGRLSALFRFEVFLRLLLNTLTQNHLLLSVQESIETLEMGFVNWLQVCSPGMCKLHHSDGPSFVRSIFAPPRPLQTASVNCAYFVWEYAQVLPQYSLHSSRAAIHFLPLAPGGLSRTFGDVFAYLDGLPHGLKNLVRPENCVKTFETLPSLL